MLTKQPIDISFIKGVDTKTDPFRVAIGNFLNLENSVFGTAGRLTKRNGFGALSPLPDTTSNLLTTFNGNLTAIGNNLQAYSQGSENWVNKGYIKPIQLDTLPLVRSNTNQSQMDSAIASNGLICTVFTDNIPNGMGGTTPSYKYVIADSITGQNIVNPTVITPVTGTVTGSPRVFLLGKYFMIVFTNNITGTYHLQYIAINSTLPTSPGTPANITSQYTPSSTVAFDGTVVNNSLYLAWNGSDGGGAIRMTYIDSTLVQHNTVSFATKVATIMSVCADSSGSTPVIWAAFYNSGSSTGYVLAVNQQLNTVLAPTQIISSGTILNINSAANNGSINVFYEVSNAYSYDSAIKTNYINTRSVTQAGVVSSVTTVIRSLGLASKAIIVDDIIYFLGIYNSLYQPTYFLIDQSGHIVSKLAYSNAGSYYVLGLPNIILNDNTIQIPYLIKDLIESVNKTQGAVTAAGIYTQTGINLASFILSTSDIVTAEIGSNLHLSGGILWMYDGFQPVEHGFNLWPDYVEVTSSTTGGFLTAQKYFYQVTYEWTDAQGNIHRSAPSIPVTVTTTGSTSSNTIDVPTLRLTYKTANPVKIVIYRWSTAQQIYYQVTSLSSPLLNDMTTDSVEFVDTLADSSIIGNNIIYTTGGVLENIAAPAVSDVTLFQSRLFYIDAEDQNLIGFSKQVIENTPVENSDLLSLFVAPTIGAQGSTGKAKCLFPMDDKLIIFKKDAMYYTSGQGPDNTGANNQYSDPVFINSTVGCSNRQSIVFMPQGLMFQSDKGIWLLGRDISTQFIGAPVQGFTQGATVLSALNVPGTNQVRFTLDSGITLMYDYYYGQWATFTNIPAISSTIYENLHTYIDSSGRVFQESPGLYLDGSNPVLMSFTTGWLNLAGLQGYERAYYFYLLGTYISPHKLNLQIAYDYNSAIQQMIIIAPDNHNEGFGSDPIYGDGSPFGGNPQLEQWRVFLKKQKCQSFQITLDEMFDPSYNTTAGAGLTLSGLNLIIGAKKGYKPIKAANSAG